MIGQFKIGRKNIYFEKFNCFRDFICTMEPRPFNWESEIDYDDTKWSGASSYEEAKSILYKGNHTTRTAFSKLNVKSEKPIKYKRVNSVVGQQVSVPRFLENHPKSTIRTVNAAKKCKTLKIIIEGGVSCGNSADSILTRSRILFNFFEHLQKENYIFDVYISYSFSHMEDSDEPGHIVALKVKEPNERLNILSKHLLSCLPSTFRIMMFRWYETFPLSKRISGYGRPIGDYKRTKELYTNILGIRKEDDICVIRLSCLPSTVNKMIELINDDKAKKDHFVVI